jgi:hypothetical protein
MALINVPNPGQTLGNSRPSINSNFAVIDAAFIVDHEDYNTTNQGMHNRVSFLSQNPVPVPQAGIVQLYSQISTITNQPELVFTHQAGSTAPIAAQIVEFTSAGWANPGWTRLPSGILLKWHAGINFTSLSTVTVNLNVDVAGSPNFTNVFAVFPSTTESSANYNTVIGIQSIVGPSVIFSIFGAVRPPAGTTIAYLAIGM